MSSRFYTPDGRAITEVPTKDGSKMRPVRVSDAIRNGWQPSWTTMIKETLAAQGLERWKLMTLLESSLTLPAVPGESMEDRAERIVRDAEEHPKRARDRGSVRHDMFMNVLTGKPIASGEHAYAQKFAEFVSANGAESVQIETPLVGSQSAGRPDWIARLAPFGNAPSLYVVDYKGQELFTEDGQPIIKNGKPKKPYYANEFWIQCAGYSLDWEEKHGEQSGGCVIVYCRNTGELFPKFLSVSEMARWRRAATLIRALWRNLHGIEDQEEAA